MGLRVAPYTPETVQASCESHKLGYALNCELNSVPSPGPDLIKLFWRSVTLLQNFKPMNDDKIGHMTILLLSDCLKILE